MIEAHIEYCVSRGSRNDWRILRQGDQIAVRRDVFDAVSVATHFAEREALSVACTVKLMLDEHRFG
jgi:hypothetical protein